jgi:hypothetical protein
LTVLVRVARDPEIEAIFTVLIAIFPVAVARLALVFARFEFVIARDPERVVI